MTIGYLSPQGQAVTIGGTGSVRYDRNSDCENHLDPAPLANLRVANY
jgi:hypothetical protein